MRVNDNIKCFSSVQRWALIALARSKFEPGDSCTHRRRLGVCLCDNRLRFGDKLSKSCRERHAEKRLTMRSLFFRRKGNNTIYVIFCVESIHYYHALSSSDMTEDPEKRLWRMRDEIEASYNRCKGAIIGTVLVGAATESPVLIGVGGIVTAGLCGLAMYKDVHMFKKENGTQQ
jgi:hypothetical protein